MFITVAIQLQACIYCIDTSLCSRFFLVLLIHSQALISTKKYMVRILARGHMGLTWKSLGLLIHMRSFRFCLRWEKKISRSLNILFTAYPVVFLIMILGLIFPFVNFHYHPKHLSQMRLKNHLDIASLECQAVFQASF